MDQLNLFTKSVDPRPFQIVEPIPICPKCAAPTVAVVGSGPEFVKSPDVIVKPPLPCGTRRTTSGQNADLWEVKATRPEWRCRWCDLGHYRLDRPNDCPYCCARWEAKESMTFESGEAAVQMRCRCGCDAEWYTARGWGETTDYRLRGSSLVTASIKTDDVGKCAFCGADTFDFVHRPDGFFRRCSGCNAIHRWR